MANRRDRANTASILGSDYIDREITDIDIAKEPIPAHDESDYTTVKLRKTLGYIDARLRHPRKPSPLGIETFEFIKDLLKQELESRAAEDVEDLELAKAKTQRIALIRSAQIHITRNAVMGITQSANAQEMLEKITDLQRRKYYLTYGEYFASACVDMRKHALDTDSPGKEALQGYWSDINDKLENEEPYWKQIHARGISEYAKLTPTWFALWEACMRSGNDMNHMAKVIRQYAIRTKLAHFDLMEMIQGNRILELRTRLYQDFQAVRLTFPIVEQETRSILQDVIRAMQERWFKWDAVDEDQPENWEMSDLLKKLRANLMEKQVRCEELKVSEAKALAEVVEGIRVARDLMKKDSVLYQVLESVERPQGAKKRVASSQLRKEQVEEKNQNKKFKSLANMAGPFKKKADAFVEEFGAIGPHPGIFVETDDEEKEMDDEIPLYQQHLLLCELWATTLGI